ncbi:MAG: xanthine dehydrogenase family protein molybdopterin-binding subunit [Candidatus Rokubacteria bacterium]|nr:xanthine dehydrogenase family protein molybdopterin-binding subunit [Candidatus Rokubacteria bacterium]
MMATTRAWIGKDIPRLEDPKLLSGRATYVDDVKLAGMLHAAVLRSPHPHARIARIDTSRARAVPGVYAVITGEDARALSNPVPAFCAEPVVEYALAVGKVRYVGEAVAAVAAVDRYTAEDAVALIEVQYEPLPVVTDPMAAMAPGAPKVHENLAGNLVFEKTMSFGDVAGAFAGATRVVRRRLRWHRASAQPLETAGAVVRHDADRTDVWSNTNMINFVGWLLAGTLKVPASKLNIHPMYVGGSFGSKHVLGKVIGIAGMLSKLAGRPVKFMEDRVDNLLACGNLACDRYYDAELAVGADGVFRGLRIKVVDDYGAYFQFGHGTHGNALAQSTGPYRMASLEYTVQCVLTNKCQQGVFRGAGSDAGNFALERLVDAAARELGLDPIEIRRRNFIAAEAFPFKSPTGNIYDSGNYPAVLDHALAMAGYPELRRMQAEARRQGRLVGIGLATAQQRSVYGPTEFWFWYDSPGLTSAPESVGLSLGPTGEFTVTMFSPFWGNSPETVVAQSLAEEFGIAPGQVTVAYGASQHALPGAGPGGSRMTVMLAGAVVGAARKLKEKMSRIAAKMLEAAPEDIVFGDGKASVRGAPDRGVSYGDIGLKAYWFKLDLPEGLESGLEARYTYDHPYLTLPSPDRKDLGAFYPIMGHGAHIPVVEVHPETGQVTILRYVAVHDVGTVVNPRSLRGQIAGGIAQGIGMALYEACLYDEHGQPLAGSFMDYLLPTAMEVPRIEIGHVETPSPFTEYGVKGGGEGGRMIAPAALASAVEDALAPLGVAIDEVPMTPERLAHLIETAPRRPSP